MLNKLQLWMWKWRVAIFVLALIVTVVTYALTDGFSWTVVVGLVFVALLSVVPPPRSTPPS